MFRPMRRARQALTQEECIWLLERMPRGVLAVAGEDGYPYAFPMDFLYRDGKIYFHTAKTGHKLDAIAQDNRVSFCVMDEGFRVKGEWALNIKSVIVFGTIKKLERDAHTDELLRQLGLKYYPTPEGVEKEMKLAADRAQLLELTIDHLTGKQVNES